MFRVAQTPGTVLCCLCGTSIPPNPSNMCVSCIRTQVDITEGLQKQVTVLFCRECGRYLQPPRTWVRAALESKELLSYCLKRMKNLPKVKLVDAGFIWTEPHSKRIKVKLTIQKEVLNGAILQQAFVVEYTVEDHMCDQCSRAAANPDQWVAVVQVRQKVDHKRTFFFLEQLILKHGADAHAINIKQMHDGVDFFYASRSHALKLVDFLAAVVPVHYRHDKQLVSHDSKSNTYHHRFTFSVEICPICKDDLVCLPPRVAASLGHLGPVVLCTRVSSSLLLLDPVTLRTAHLDATQFWRYPFRPLLTAKQLVEYVVLDEEEVAPPAAEQQAGGRGGGGGRRLQLADVQVARSADFGKNDQTFSLRTHLGGLLHPGDMALGYDLYGANLNDDALDGGGRRNVSLPDVVLVRKSYEEKRRRRRGRARPWKLRTLAMEAEAAPGKGEEEKDRSDFERFLEEVEEDPDLRSRIAVFKDSTYVPSAPPGGAAGGGEEEGEEGGEEPPEVPLEELLDGLQLEDARRPPGGGGDSDDDAEMEL